MHFRNCLTQTSAEKVLHCGSGHIYGHIAKNISRMLFAFTPVPVIIWDTFNCQV